MVITSLVFNFRKSGRYSHTLTPMDLKNLDWCWSDFFFSPLLLQDDQNDSLAEVTVAQSESTGAERQEEAAEEGEEGTNVEEVAVTQVEEKRGPRSTRIETLC